MATLSKGGGTPRMVIMLDNNPISTMMPHSTFKLNSNENFKISILACKLKVAKLQQFLAHQTINMACVVPSVVVVCNEKGIF